MPERNLYNEPELLQRVSQGDQQAFTELFMHHRGKVYSTIRRLTDSKVMAEEILQDVFLKIWLKRNELGAIHDFQAYLHTIARRATYRGLKQLAKEKQYVQPASTENEPVFHLTGENILELKEYDDVLKQAIERLPPKQYETFHLIREQGYKRAEVAEKLGVSPETVKYNFEEGMRKIRAYFMTHTDFLPAITSFLISLCVIIEDIAPT